METLKKYFPYAFAAKKDVAALVINILIHIVVGAVIGFVFSLLSFIPILGIVIGLAGTLIDIYITASLVLSILDYFKILK